eukprot:gene26322-17417_t
MEKFLVKRRKIDDDGGSTGGGTPSSSNSSSSGTPPRIIMSLNANSIKLRCERGEIKSIAAFMKRSSVQGLLIQETRIKTEDKPAVEKAIIAAIRAEGLGEFRMYWSSHPSKRYSGTAFIVHSSHAPKSVRFGFNKLADPAIKYPQAPPLADIYIISLQACKTLKLRETEGRIIIADYDVCSIVNVYVPNCGWDAPPRARRDAWDRRMISVVQALERKNKPVLLMGDLNVCHLDLDVSHPDFFAAARKPRTQMKPGEIPAEAGQPGELHPESRRLTWGFGPSCESGLYAGKGMGLDYGLVSRSLWSQQAVIRSEVCGASGAFGSDHCAVFIEIDWSKGRLM